MVDASEVALGPEEALKKDIILNLPPSGAYANVNNSNGPFLTLSIRIPDKQF